MKTFGLHLESGPRRRKTMVHVPELLGCIANGPTTEDALDATPAAINAYRRFLCRRGEAIDPDAPFETVIREHNTEGDMLGEGSPYVTFVGDLQPICERNSRRIWVAFGRCARNWLHGRQPKRMINSTHSQKREEGPEEQSCFM